MSGSVESQNTASELRSLRLQVKVMWILLVVLPVAVLVFDISATRARFSRVRTKAIFAEAVVIQLADGQFHHAALSAGKPGAALSFYDGNDRYRLGIGVGADGNPYVTLFDGQGQARARVRVEKGGDGVFETFGADGRLLWRSPGALP